MYLYNFAIRWLCILTEFKIQVSHRPFSKRNQEGTKLRTYTYDHIRMCPSINSKNWPSTCRLAQIELFSSDIYYALLFIATTLI